MFQDLLPWPGDIDQKVAWPLAILSLSNDAEATRDPFQGRLRLNELQSGIQAIKVDLEAIAEGVMLSGGWVEGQEDDDRLEEP